MTSSTQSIREIVTAAPWAVAVLERFEIDPCRQGDARLAQACAELQLSVEQVLEKLADAELQAHGAFAPDLESYSMTRLIQHIVRTHHKTVRRDLPGFIELARTLEEMHGDAAPEYGAAAALLMELRAEMTAHFEKEEQILFPYIVQLDEAAGAPAPTGCARPVAGPVSAMVREHDAAQAIVRELRALLNGFEAPAGACTRSKALHAGLAAFEADLNHHIHLENDLLFPRAIAAELPTDRRNQTWQTRRSINSLS